MRKTLRCGSETFQVVGRNESVLTFREESDALKFLEPLARFPDVMKILRQQAANHLTDPQQLKDAEFLKRLAPLLVSGKIRFLRTRLARAAGSAVEAEEAAAEGKAPPMKNSSWIEIFLRDSEGNPVPGQKYQIKLPDGSTQEGLLDAFGHAEYYDINAGNCELTFPDLEADCWEKMQ